MMELSRSLTATTYIFNEDRVLLHKHKKYNSLFPIGGHMEKDELPEQTAIREIKEETGIEDICFVDAAPQLGLQRGQLITPFFVLQENIGRDENIDFIFAARTNQWEVFPEEGESDEFYWLTKNEIEESQELKPHIKSVALALFDKLFC